MRSRLIMLLSLLFPFSSLSYCSPASGQEGEAASLGLRAYVPARILVSYTYTNNFSVTDISSVGKSLYKIISGPTNIEFQASDIDIYTFIVELKYAAIVAQSIQIAVFSAGNPPEGIQFNVKGSSVRLKFSLTATKEPVYPSAQEVAEQVVLQVAGQLSAFQTQTERVVNTQSRNLQTQWCLIIFNLIVNVAVLLTLFLWLRPRLEQGRR